MKSFKQFDTLTESKNLHMEHLEDAVFNEGMNGVLDAIRFLESVTEMLSGSGKGKANLTVKWDGAPAVFAGTHPETKKFFVGSKSIFNNFWWNNVGDVTTLVLVEGETFETNSM